MAQQNQRAVDVLPAAKATPAGDGRVGSAGLQDLQHTRLVIDIGDSKTIEITLRGKLTLESIGAGEGGGSGTTTAAQLAPPGEHGTEPSEQAVEDKKFLEQMRGWLMTVATLFIGISFQAAMQPPSWITPDWYDAAFPKRRRSSAPAAPSPSPAGAAAATMTRARGNRAFVYVACNTLTFAISLALVILLLLMNKSPPTHAMAMVRLMVAALCFFVGIAFLSGNSYGPHATAMVAMCLICYGLGTFFLIVYSSRILRFLRSGRCRGSRAS